MRLGEALLGDERRTSAEAPLDFICPWESFAGQTTRNRLARKHLSQQPAFSLSVDDRIGGEVDG